MTILELCENEKVSPMLKSQWIVNGSAFSRSWGCAACFINRRSNCWEMGGKSGQTKIFVKSSSSSLLQKWFHYKLLHTFLKLNKLGILEHWKIVMFQYFLLNVFRFEPYIWTRYLRKCIFGWVVPLNDLTKKSLVFTVFQAYSCYISELKNTSLFFKAFLQIYSACCFLNCLFCSISVLYGVKWVFINRTDVPFLNVFPGIFV